MAFTSWRDSILSIFERRACAAHPNRSLCCTLHSFILNKQLKCVFSRHDTQSNGTPSYSPRRFMFRLINFLVNRHLVSICGYHDATPPENFEINCRRHLFNRHRRRSLGDAPTLIMILVAHQPYQQESKLPSIERPKAYVRLEPTESISNCFVRRNVIHPLYHSIKTVIIAMQQRCGTCYLIPQRQSTRTALP